MVDQVTITATDSSGPNKPETPAKTSERPQWLPEKFKNPEDLAAAYVALEGKLGAPKADPAQSGEAAKPTDAKLEIPAPAKGSTLEPFFKEYSEKGALSDESLAKLEKQGLPRDVVQTYIEGYKAKAQADLNNMLAPVGGPDAWNQIVAWAQQSLPADQIETFNKVVTGGSPEAIRLAVSGLKAQYDLSNGVQGQRLSGTQAPAGGIQPFKSHRQMVEAMKDKRYQNDPAYRQEVMDRVSASGELI